MQNAECRIQNSEFCVLRVAGGAYVLSWIEDIERASPVCVAPDRLFATRRLNGISCMWVPDDKGDGFVYVYRACACACANTKYATCGMRL